MTMKGKIPWNKGKKMPHSAAWEEKRIAAVREVVKNTTYPRGYKRPKEHTQPMLDALAQRKKENPSKYKAVAVANLPKNCNGEKNGNWKGGVTPFWRSFRTTKRYREWRTSVLLRDNSRCKNCGAASGLHVHHIVEISECIELAHLRMNGVTLCSECHKATGWGKKPKVKLGAEKVIIKTIPHEWQDYETVGNWGIGDNGIILVLVSEVNDWRYEMLVAFHEFSEAILCKHRGITQGSVDAFDIAFEKKRPDGDLSEPGDDPFAPYYREHQFATCVERLLALELEVDWTQYNADIEKMN